MKALVVSRRLSPAGYSVSAQPSRYTLSAPGNRLRSNLPSDEIIVLPSLRIRPSGSFRSRALASTWESLSAPQIPESFVSMIARKPSVILSAFATPSAWTSPWRPCGNISRVVTGISLDSWNMRKPFAWKDRCVAISRRSYDREGSLRRRSRDSNPEQVQCRCMILPN